MLVARSAMIAVLVAAPLPARAVDLLLGWDARGVWTSNVFRTERDEESDFSIYTGPNLGLRVDQGDLRFDVEYRPRYEAFAEFTDVSGFEHFADVEASWSITRRTDVNFINRFARTSSLREIVEGGLVVDDPTSGDVFADRESILRNFATASVNHVFSPRLYLSTSFDQQLYRYDDAARADSTSYRVGSTLRRQLTRRQTAGLGFGVTQQRFDLEPEQVNHIVEAFGLYEFVVDPAWRVSLSGGPAWVLPDEGQEVLVVDDGGIETRGGGDDVNLTFYGNGLIRYARPTHSVELSYTRRASVASGTGAATNLDIVALVGTWIPDRRWRFTLRTSWDRQTSAYDQLQFLGFFVLPGFPAPQPLFRSVSDAVDLTAYRVDLRAVHRLTRRLELVALVSWWRQDSQGGFDLEQGALVPSPDETRDNLRFEIGFRWNFDPIAL